nr:zinc finger, CCHC-type [Tanacetum cinerariifolium]
MASMNTRLNIKKLDGNIVQKHGGSEQVGFKQLGPGVKTGVHEVHDEKHVWFEVELQGVQGDREAERSTQQCMKSRVAKHLGVTGIQQQYGLVYETNMALFAKVLHGFEFEVEPLGDHTFEVEPHENINQGAGLQEIQTQDLMDYPLTRDKEQHLACELFGYREDSNEAAFAVAVVDVPINPSKYSWLKMVSTQSLHLIPRTDKKSMAHLSADMISMDTTVHNNNFHFKAKMVTT